MYQHHFIGRRTGEERIKGKAVSDPTNKYRHSDTDMILAITRRDQSFKALNRHYNVTYQ